MPASPGTRRRPTIVTTLVAVVVLSTVMIGSASAATTDPDDVLRDLDVITGRDLEVVDTSGLVNGP